MNKHFSVLFSAATLFILGTSPSVADSDTQSSYQDGATAVLSCNTSSRTYEMSTPWTLTTDSRNDKINYSRLYVNYSNGQSRPFIYPVNPAVQSINNVGFMDYGEAYDGQEEFAELMGSVTARGGDVENKRVGPLYVTCTIGRF